MKNPTHNYAIEGVVSDRDELELRRLSDAASPGPWTAHPDGLVWAPRPGDPVSGSTEPEDAAFIAALANWFRSQPVSDRDEGLAGWIAEVRGKFKLPTTAEGNPRDYWTGYAAAIEDLEDRLASQPAQEQGEGRDDD